MANGSTHPSLLSRVRDPADGHAWREFEARYGPLILGYCRRMGVQFTDAEDVRQVVLTDLARSLPGFEFQPQRGKFRTYLGRVVRNAISRHFRRHGRRQQNLGSTILAVTPGQDQAEADERWEREWILHHYRLAIEMLRRTCDAKSIEVFQELVSGRTIGEVAARSDMTAEAVRKIKQRMKDRLRAVVASQILEEDAPDESR